MKELNQERLSEAVQLLNRYSQSEKHKVDAAERRERQSTFAKLLGEPFSEFQFAQVIRQLWAAQLWTNREYLVSQILTSNGIDRVRSEWEALLSGKGSPEQRYEQFVTSIKHMGPSMVTEILCLHEPKAAGIWNNVARQSLGWLYDGDPFFRKYRLSASEYKTFNNLLQALGKRLPSLATGEESDLLGVDYALWEIRELAVTAKGSKSEEPVSVPTAGRSRHNELRDKVVQIGTGLGFDAQSEIEVAPGSKVDVVWRAKIGNLGSVAYVFEVQDKGSIDSLIVNLQQARATLGAKKLCVVSDRDQLEKIQKRLQTMPEELRRNLSYWEAVEVDDVFENMESVTQVFQKIKLLE